MRTNNTTTIKTFKVKELKSKLTIPAHQRWQLKPHVKTLGRKISSLGFLESICLHEKGNGFYSLENGYQRWSSICEDEKQEVHCIVVPKDTPQDEVFISLNTGRAGLQIYDFIRTQNYHPTTDKTSVNNPYVYVWNEIYSDPENDSELNRTVKDGLFSHSAIRFLFFNYNGVPNFNIGKAKLKKYYKRKRSLFFKIKSNYTKDVVNSLSKKDVDSYEKVVHKLLKVALAETLERIIKDNNDKTNEEIYNLLIYFAVYIEKKMPTYLTCTKDNIRKYYVDWKEND
jgi:CRISPR/Cas system CSM-associated protein Csm2 small subunit